MNNNAINIPLSQWQHSSRHEIRFYRQRVQQWLEGKKYAQIYLDPNSVLQEYLAKLLPSSGSTASILDVGSGPLTTVNKTWPGVELSITAVDALADKYNQTMRKAGMAPLVQAQQGFGEDLCEMFEPDMFDITHSVNAIDHTFDPVKVIENMIALTRPGGYVVIQVNENEADYSRGGLHNWNFYRQNDDLIMQQVNTETATNIRSSF